MRWQMVVFYGELSNETKIDRSKRGAKNATKTFMILLILSLVGLYATCVFEDLHDLIWILMLFVILDIIVIISTNTSSVIYRVLKYPNAPHITIDDESITRHLWAGGNYYPTKKSLSKVKKVLDCGDWYYIIFKFGDITNSWTCQKDLIIEGTIEEFEKLFEGKIVRKYKTKD